MIDRCNFDRVQRSHWVRIAREWERDARVQFGDKAPKVLVSAVVLDPPFKVALSRAQTRIGHAGGVVTNLICLNSGAAARRMRGVRCMYV